MQIDGVFFTLFFLVKTLNRFWFDCGMTNKMIPRFSLFSLFSFFLSFFLSLRFSFCFGYFFSFSFTVHTLPLHVKHVISPFIRIISENYTCTVWCSWWWWQWWWRWWRNVRETDRRRKHITISLRASESELAITYERNRVNNVKHMTMRSSKTSKTKKNKKINHKRKIAPTQSAKKRKKMK